MKYTAEQLRQAAIESIQEEKRTGKKSFIAFSPFDLLEIVNAIQEIEENPIFEVYGEEKHGTND